jgi:hypothetical protein
MAYMIKIKANKVTSYVGPFAQEAFAKAWIHTSRHWLALNYPSLSPSFKVIPLVNPYKASTVSLLTIVEH